MVTLQGETKTWSQYKFGRFSDWAGHFNATNGNGQIEIYENVGGKRGSLLAQASRFLPPGPVLITIKGDWPPTSDTPTALGSIEAIANSFTKPANGSAEVRLFNLGPDTPTASMSANGKVTASNVDFTLGSTWSTMPASKTSFTITDATGKTLASFDQTPPGLQSGFVCLCSLSLSLSLSVSLSVSVCVCASLSLSLYVCVRGCVPVWLG